METNLRNYPLPYSLVDTFNRIDQTAARMERNGIEVPSVAGVSQRDFETVDTIVRRITAGRGGAYDVQWNGRSIIPIKVPVRP